MAERDYERSDVSPSAALIAAAVLSISVILIVAVLWLLRGHFRDDENRPAPSVELMDGPPTPPRLQTEPPVDLAALTAAQRRRLTSWGWVERDQGIARIPIDDAMALLAARGWPDGERVDVLVPPPPPPPQPEPDRKPLPSAMDGGQP